MNRWTALLVAVGIALKHWVDENKTEVLQALRACRHAHAPGAVSSRQDDGGGGSESGIDMVRQDRLSRILIGKRALVPMVAIAQCEKQGLGRGREITATG
jgi:hypothetical protein